MIAITLAVVSMCCSCLGMYYACQSLKFARIAIRQAERAREEAEVTVYRDTDDLFEKLGIEHGETPQTN